MASDSSRHRFLDELRGLGGKAGNQSLRAALGWTEGYYRRIQSELLDEGRIESGRGRGGSVRIVTRPSQRRVAVAASRTPTDTKKSSLSASTCANCRSMASRFHSPLSFSMEEADERKPLSTHLVLFEAHPAQRRIDGVLAHAARLVSLLPSLNF